MTKITECPLSRLVNEEHFKFNNDVDGLITLHTPSKLNIETEYAGFKSLLVDESEALNFVRKSSFSAMIGLAEDNCDATIDGFGNAIKSGLNHYNGRIKDASERIKVLWDANSNVKVKALKIKSGAIIKLLSELNGDYKSDVMTAGLDGWVTALANNFSVMESLQNKRYSDNEKKTELRMKEVRGIIDESYRSITSKINALIIVNGETEYKEFVKALNLRIEAYSNSLAMRKASHKKADDNVTKAE